MAVNKVVFGNTTVMDITDSTVTASKLKSGETAYAANGAKITGELVVPEVLDDLSDVTINTPANAHEIYYNGSQWINYGAKILLTFDDAFQGQTITLSKDQTVITKVAPSTGNSMSLYVSETGEWTISSTIDEETYETVVTITAFGITYAAELESTPPTPEGSTVEPTDDIQIWLACANLNKPYTTLEAVLADRETFETLIADSNACDYMARSTTWASDTTDDADAMSLIGKYDYCSNALLSNATWCEAIANSDYFREIYNFKNPNMTSNTTPSGVASASSVYNNLAQYQAWKAFNGTNVDSADTWASALNSSVNSYIQYQFTEPKEISMIRWENRNNTSASTICSPKTYKIQGYDGSAWVDLTEELTNSDNSTSAKHIVWVTKNKASYQYYRMFIINAWTSGSDTYCCVAEFQLYGRKSNEVLVPLVPTMTSNTTPSGTCSANISPSGFEPYKAFDKDTSTRWASSSGNGSWLEYDFGATKTVKAFSVYPLYHSSNTLLLKSYKIQGSNDNFSSDINDLYEETLSNTNVGVVQRNFTNAVNYRYYRLLATSNSYYTSGDIGILELQFYDRTVQTNIIHSCANDTIYYMEEGSPVIVATTNSDGDGILDFSSLEDKEYTFYSSVAKDPSNLSDDFSKTIRITKSEFGGTTEMYLMSDTVKTLYWWGYESDNLEDMTASNGWTQSNYSYDAPTHNTNNITCVSPSNKLMGVASKNKIKGSNFKSIIRKTGSGDNNLIFYNSLKNTNSTEMAYTVFNNTSDAITQLQIPINEAYIGIRSAVGSSSVMSALWYE